MARVLSAGREPFAAAPDCGKRRAPARGSAASGPWLIAKLTRAFQRLAARLHHCGESRLGGKGGEDNSGSNSAHGFRSALCIAKAQRAR
jgi:hypothetical protein